MAEEDWSALGLWNFLDTFPATFCDRSGDAPGTLNGRSARHFFGAFVTRLLSA
jgi:hypothetical protein